MKIHNPFSKKQTTKKNTFIFIWTFFFVIFCCYAFESIDNNGGRYNFFSSEKKVRGGGFLAQSEDDFNKTIEREKRKYEKYRIIKKEEVRPGVYKITTSYSYDKLSENQFQALGAFLAFLLYSIPVAYISKKSKGKLLIAKILIIPYAYIMILIVGVIGVFTNHINLPIGP